MLRGVKPDRLAPGGESNPTNIKKARTMRNGLSIGSCSWSLREGMARGNTQVTMRFATAKTTLYILKIEFLT
jgi:hypothetical protein